jgi:hypothetical protein
MITAFHDAWLMITEIMESRGMPLGDERTSIPAGRDSVSNTIRSPSGRQDTSRSHFDPGGAQRRVVKIPDHDVTVATGPDHGPQLMITRILKGNASMLTS